MSTADRLFVVGPENATAIDRLPKSHKVFDEAWVRDLVFKNPVLLPVEDVRSDAGTLLPIGIEIPLDRAGIADVLGVTTGGYPVVVETKLWRNPQARREVLAQTIDYVKEIAKHDYQWLNELWAAQQPPGSSMTLFDAAAEQSDSELDEVEFIDRIDRACRSGDILGFIVGDGIQRGLSELIAHLGRESSHLRYNLSLLELKCFELADGEIAVLPAVVREVLPVERAYIRIEPAPEVAGQVNIVSKATQKTDEGEKPRRTTLTEDEFWTELETAVGSSLSNQVRDFVSSAEQTAGLELQYKQRALMLKVPDPDGVEDAASVLAITSTGMAYNPTHGIRQAKKWGISEERVNGLFGDYFRGLNQICSGFQLDGIVHLRKGDFVPLSDCVQELSAIEDCIATVASRLRAERTGE